MKKTSLNKALLLVLQSIVCLALAFATILAGKEFSIRYKLQYNELGRYFDEASAAIYEEQALPFYGLMFVFFLTALLFAVRWTIKPFKQNERKLK